MATRIVLLYIFYCLNRMFYVAGQCWKLFLFSLHRPRHFPSTLLLYSDLCFSMKQFLLACLMVILASLLKAAFLRSLFPQLGKSLTISCPYGDEINLSCLWPCLHAVLLRRFMLKETGLCRSPWEASWRCFSRDMTLWKNFVHTLWRLLPSQQRQ